MTLKYPTTGMVLGLKGKRLRLELTAIRREFELHECLLVGIIINSFDLYAPCELRELRSIVRIDMIHSPAGCCKRRLNQS